MLAFTQNNPSVCLAHDDLEAIQTIYPDCLTSSTTPVCYRVNLNLGIVRIASFVLLPLIIVLLLVLTMQSIIQYHNREELREHKQELKARQKAVVAGKFSLAAAAAAEKSAKKKERSPLATPSTASSRSASKKSSWPLKSPKVKLGTPSPQSGTDSPPHVPAIHVPHMPHLHIDVPHVHKHDTDTGAGVTLAGGAQGGTGFAGLVAKSKAKKAAAPAVAEAVVLTRA